MKMFIFLDDCLLGENIKMELFFIFLKKKSFKEIIKYIFSSNKLEKLLEIEKELNFENLFLQQKVVEEIKKQKINYNIENIFIVTDFNNINLNSLEINEENININILKEKDFKEEMKKEEKFILITGNYFHIKYTFKSEKTIYVGPVILGKIINSINVGRTIVINRDLGIFTTMWDYFFNIVNNLFILWPLLFFLPSTNFNLWKYTFAINIILTGFLSLWRHFLELENERKFYMENKEVLLGTNFIFLHHSTFANMILSIFFLFLILIFSFQSFIHFKALIISIIYSTIHFFFLARKRIEHFLAKLIIVIFLPIIFEPSTLNDLLKLFFQK